MIADHLRWLWDDATLTTELPQFTPISPYGISAFEAIYIADQIITQLGNKSSVTSS